jgi:ABC-2 type transport system ATP-binding protein
MSPASDMSPAPAIDLAGVSKRFGAVQALDQLSLRIEKGTIFGFLGPNGAGKTTTLRCLLGLVRADAGQLRVLGLDPVRDGREIRRRVGVLLTDDGLYDRLSAWQNLDFHARIHHLPKGERQQRIEELLGSFDLWQRRAEPVSRFSKGMRQKLAVARSLIHRPVLLLLDEPFSGLDPMAAVELRGRIAGLARQQEVTVLLTTHDLAHVEKLCQRVAVIRQGRIIAEGTPDELRAPGTGSMVELEVAGEGLSAEVLSALQAAGVLAGYEMNGGGTARVRCHPEQRRRLAAELVNRGVAIDRLNVVGSSLEEAFLALFAEGDGAASPQPESGESP